MIANALKQFRAMKTLVEASLFSPKIVHLTERLHYIQLKKWACAWVFKSLCSRDFPCAVFDPLSKCQAVHGPNR